jgi:hypothetical protein
MNQAHIDFLSSPDWARMLETDLLPWIAEVGDLGDDIIEIGPGPGLTTDLLRTRAARVTAVEVDGTRTGIGSARFSAATCFSVLHHMPTRDEQDRLFVELHRLLRPGGIFVGADSRDLDIIRAGHADDVFNPIDPYDFTQRVARAGFTNARIDVGDYQFRFVARKPLGG